LLHRKRFLQETIHTDRGAAFPNAFLYVGGQGNDRYRRQAKRAFVRSDPLSRFETVHYRHVAIHQNHLVTTIRRRFAGHQTIGGNIDTVTAKLQHLLGHGLIYRIVIRQQYGVSPHVRQIRRQLWTLVRRALLLDGVSGIFEHAVMDIGWT